MEKYKAKTYNIADMGDYLKVFACTAVMSQPILSMILAQEQSYNTQTILGILYNLVKYTAPAFIFGILYTTIRSHDLANSFTYKNYLRTNWSNLFVPTIWWTLAYLLLMPWLQQRQHYHNFLSFCWQFINGNAAPHLWYNTMMLQFIILMPFFWQLDCYLKNNKRRGLYCAVITFLGYFLWLWFYDVNVFRGPHQSDWYLLDRIFISFIIYGIYGLLAWQFRDYYNTLITKYRWLILFLLIICFIWTNLELFSFGHPVNFGNAPYYKPSVCFYCLLIIALVTSFCLQQIRKNTIRSLKSFHFLALYAYRAYLSNVFWEQIVWLGLKTQKLAIGHPFLCLFSTWILTWLLSFASAYGFHVIWSRIKNAVKKF